MKVEKLHYTLVITLIAFLSISYFIYPLLGADSGFYLATAREFYNGKTYFTDIAIAYNPLAIITLGLPFLFSESPDPRWSLLLNMFAIWASSYVLFTLLQRINRNKKANLFYALFFVLGCLLLDGSHLMLEPISVFFQLWGLLLYVQAKESEKSSCLFFAGCCFALSFLSKQYGLFILAPIGIDMLLNRGQIVKKILFVALGFGVPIAALFLYLANNGVDFIAFIRYILGIGLKLDVGNGTGINFSFSTYVLGFAVFVAYNLYVLLIPGLLWKSRRKLPIKNTLFLTILPFSFLVLFSASYAHYFIYVLPYALLAFAFLWQKEQQKLLFKQIAFTISLFLMCGVSLYSYSRKQQKINIQEETVSKLSAEIPKKSKVYLDGISPAFYYLCDFRSVKLDRLGFTFPGYFYPQTIVGLMEPHSYLVVSQSAFPSYRILVRDLPIKEITINSQVFFIIIKE